MAALIDLEKKVWQLQFRDGSWEFMFGMMFVIFAIRTLTDQVYFTGLIIVGLVVFIFGKKMITMPRLGRVKFGKERVKRQQWAGLVFAAVLMGMMALFVLSALGIFLADSSKIIIVALLVMVFTAVAYYLDYWMFLLIGMVFGAQEIIFQLYGDTNAAYFGIAAGSLLLLAGIRQFTRFIKKYPKPAEEVSDACR